MATKKNTSNLNTPKSTSNKSPGGFSGTTKNSQSDATMNQGIQSNTNQNVARGTDTSTNVDSDVEQLDEVDEADVNSRSDI